MTKSHLAEQILQYVENNPNDREEQLDGIINMLDVLEPKNLGQFAQWGYPDQISTPKECWR